MTLAPSFDELLARARLGDQEAMAELVRQYESEVRMVARARLGAALRPHLDSIDLVQSVHRSLMVGLRDEKFDISSPDKLIGLALTIVRRKVARHWRRIRRQQRLSGAGNDSSSDMAMLLVSLTSPEASPDQAAELRDAAALLWNEVDENEQLLIQLRLEGNSTAEVARQLGLDPDVLRVRLSRLRRRLRERGLFSDWL